MNFNLHPQLQNDLILIGELELSLVFLLPDSDHPWIVIVPQVLDITEFYQLTNEQQSLHCSEINKVSHALETLFNPDKLNIGMLGNMVPQLHTHIICRFKNDRAWPGSIWGTDLVQDQAKITTYIESLKRQLKLC